MARPQKVGVEYFPLDVDMFKYISCPGLTQLQNNKCYKMFSLNTSHVLV